MNDHEIDRQQYQIRKIMNTILASILLLICIICCIVYHIKSLLIYGILILAALMLGLQIMSFFRKNQEKSESEK